MYKKSTLTFYYNFAFANYDYRNVILVSKSDSF